MYLYLYQQLLLGVCSWCRNSTCPITTKMWSQSSSPSSHLTDQSASSSHHGTCRSPPYLHTATSADHRRSALLSHHDTCRSPPVRIIFHITTRADHRRSALFSHHDTCRSPPVRITFTPGHLLITVCIALTPRYWQNTTCLHYFSSMTLGAGLGLSGGGTGLGLSVEAGGGEERGAGLALSWGGGGGWGSVGLSGGSGGGRFRAVRGETGLGMSGNGRVTKTGCSSPQALQIVLQIIRLIFFCTLHGSSW